MFTGYDVSEAISPTTQAGGMKSNVFGIGYDDGKRASIGVSFKGRLWSMSSSTIPDWRKWCASVANKVIDEQLPTEGFLAHTLIPREIGALPASPIISILLPDEWISEPEAFRAVAGMEAHNILTIGIEAWQRNNNERVTLSIAFGTNLVVAFELRWAAERFEVRQLDGQRVTIDKDDAGLASYLAENPPVLLLADGSEVRGNLLLSHPEQLRRLFDINQIRVLTEQAGK